MLSDDQHRRHYGKLMRAAHSWPGPHPVIIMWRSFHEELRDWCHLNGAPGFASDGRTVGRAALYLVPDRSTPTPFDIGDADDERIAAIIGDHAR